MAEEAKYDQQNIEKKSDHGVTGPVKIGEHAAAPPVETTDRGLFNFKGKKDGDKKCEEEVTATPFEEKNNESLLQKIHQSGNAPIDHGGEKIEKKHQDTSVPVEIKEKYDGIPPAHEETAEKKGFLDKIKEKLPGGQKKEGELDHVPAPVPPPQVAVDYGTPDGEAKEKKGFVTKIKDKLPGNHSKTEDQEIKEKI